MPKKKTDRPPVTHIYLPEREKERLRQLSEALGVGSMSATVRLLVNREYRAHFETTETQRASVGSCDAGK